MSTAQETMAAAERGEGCLGKAADDEPVFILRAQDKLAPAVVEWWATYAVNHGVSPTSRKIAEARKLAHEMRAWQAVNQTKMPD